MTTRSLRAISKNIASPDVAPLKVGESWCVAVEVLPDSEQKHIDKLCANAKKLLNSIVMVDVNHIKNYDPESIKTVRFKRFEN